MVDYNDLSKNLLDKLAVIQKRIKQYPVSLVRADFINEHGDYKLVELNSRPGLASSAYDSSDFYWKIGVQIADAIIEFFSKQQTETSKLPLMIVAPHAKTTVPKSVRKRILLSDYEIWRLGDPFTGFTSSHPRAGVHIKGTANRILCDLSQGKKPVLKFRETDFYGNTIFAESQEFTVKERQDFLHTYSKPYRDQIIKGIEKLAGSGAKKILIVDHHNTASEHPVNASAIYMPAITVSNGGKRHTGKKQTETPEILSCPPEYLHSFKAKFDDLMDFRTEINHIYKMSHTLRWIIADIAPLYPDTQIHGIFIEYDLNLIHNPITKRNDHLAKAKLRDAINLSIDEIFKKHF